MFPIIVPYKIVNGFTSTCDAIRKFIEPEASSKNTWNHWYDIIADILATRSSSGLSSRSQFEEFILDAGLVRDIDTRVQMGRLEREAMMAEALAESQSPPLRLEYLGDSLLTVATLHKLHNIVLTEGECIMMNLQAHAAKWYYVEARGNSRSATEVC